MIHKKRRKPLICRFTVENENDHSINFLNHKKKFLGTNNHHPGWFVDQVAFGIKDLTAIKGF